MGRSNFLLVAIKQHIMKKSNITTKEMIVGLAVEQVELGDPEFVRMKFDEIIALNGDDAFALSQIAKALIYEMRDYDKTGEYDLDRYLHYINQLPSEMDLISYYTVGD
jgi:hypothetical protein